MSTHSDYLDTKNRQTFVSIYYLDRNIKEDGTKRRTALTKDSQPCFNL